MTQALSCPRCERILDPDHGRARAARCPGCGARVFNWVGPLFGRAAAPRSGAVALAGQAVCFFHPGRRAETACDSCGRFVCAVCDLPAGTAHLCPTCVEEGRSPQAAALQGLRRVRVERLVLAGALLSLIPPFLFVSFLSAPALLYFGVRGWGASAGLLPFLRRSVRWRLALGMGIAAVALAVWGWFGARLLLKLLA